MSAGATNSNRAFIRKVDLPTRLFIFWTLFVVFCQCAGWGLSALGSLNAAGYAVAFLLFFATIAWGCARVGSYPKRPNVRAVKRRFKRPIPLGFLILATLAILGGVLYAPNNFDAHTYRTPRVLQWLAEGRWHWIHSHFGDLNTRGAGFEWVTAPLFAFAKTDRLEFLINAVCFLFLPGRVFAVLTRLGIRPRVAYHWMWIYPTGYGFLLQAGSIGNDLFATLWPMAAFEFALRARETNHVEFAWLSVLAAALMTASKAFNLLLLPAWGIAMFPILGLLLRRPIGSITTALIAITASMIPTAILNIRHCGDWTGLAAEPVNLIGGPPFFQIAVNIVLVLMNNLAPPIFPFTAAWDRFVSHTVPPHLAGRLEQFFEPDAAHFHIGEMQAEEWAGIGFGVSILLLVILLAQLRRGGRLSLQSLLRFRNWIVAATLAGAFIFMMKSGLSAPARYLLPLYFPLIIPILALPVATDLVRGKLWQRLTIAMFALATILIFVTPARPLWPALTILNRTNASSSSALGRAAVVYSVYRQRADLLGPIRQALPADAKIIGVLMNNYPQTALWRPFGTRRILQIRVEDSPAFTRSRGIEFVVIGPSFFMDRLKISVNDWVLENDGEIIGEFPIKAQVRSPAADWALVRLKH